MTISIGKTKILVVAKNPIKCKLTNDNKIIEQVAEVECLGIKIFSDEKVEEEDA
jgi:hypothetical protein